MASPIEFEGYRIESIEYERRNQNEDSDTQDTLFTPDIELRFDKDYKNGLVVLRIKLVENDGRYLSIQLHGFFTITKSDATVGEAKELLALNGTTILMPYARSIISMITSLDSPKAIIMPTVNVHELLNS